MAKKSKNCNVKKSEIINKIISKKNSKDCRVKLERMSEKQYEIYSNSHTIITKDFHIKINGSTLKVNNLTQTRNDGINIFRLRIAKNSCGDLVMEHITDETPKPERKRLNRAVKSEIESQLSTKHVAKATQLPRTLDYFISNSWSQCKKTFRTSNQSLNVDDLVMAKMKSYSPWAGQITGYTKDKSRAYILFFGTHDKGSVDVAEIVPFNQCHDAIRLLLMRNTSDFHKSIYEIERIMAVPAEMSLLNEQHALK